MEKVVILYNGLADNKKGYENAQELKKFVEGEAQFEDLTKIEDFAKFFAGFDKTQKFILTGGDGTVNHFVNDVEYEDIPDNLQYYPSGTGNDFYHDISEREKTDGLVDVKKYFKNLPVATVKGKSYKFVDNASFGIDGYCCEKADELKAKSDKPINYTGIAIKGLLGGFKPRDARIVVDGKEMHFKKVWLAPVMKGKYVGGGMIPCPEQDRDGDKLSILVWHCGNKFKTLINFSKIFKGEHIKKAKMCEVYTGKEFVVEYVKPCAAQIDGETILDVTKVEVKA